MRHDFAECESLTGRKREICRNEAGLPLDGPHSTNGYRSRAGFFEINEDGSRKSGSSSPTLLQQAASFAGAMGRAAIETVKTGKPLVPQEITEERLAICKGCPFYTGSKCKKCGCACNGGASIANKLALAAEECPLKKWGPFVAINPDNLIPKPTDPAEPIPANFTGPVVRHMIYHIWPTTKSEMWKWNVAELLKRIDQFDGKRIVGIATGNDTATIAEVKTAFTGVRIDEWITVPNDKLLGEAATFFKMMALLPNGENDITWYGHAKGVKYEPGQLLMVPQWTDLLYRTTLDRPAQTEQLLSQFPIAGPFKRYGDYDKPNTWRWHYSGTFFWFRNKETLARDWKRHVKFYGAIECWPSCVFKATQAACLLGDDAGNLYSEPEIEKHAKAYAASLPSVSIIVTCKGRLSYLKQALPTMLAQDYKGQLQIIIVDYGCPDGTAEWCETQPVKCVRVEAEFFNMSRARNIGAVASDADILCFCDSHNMLKPHYVSTIVSRLWMVDLVYPENAPGSGSFSRDLFTEMRGYDESLTDYGWDDVDFYGRVRTSGRSTVEIADGLLSVMPHTDEEKLRFFSHKDLWGSIEINKKKCEDLTRIVNTNGFGR